MNKQRLNELVLAYQGGNEDAVKELFSTVNPLIERASKEVEPFVDDFTKFDCRVVTEVKRQIATFKEGEHDFLAMVKTIITQSKHRFIRRNSRKVENHVSMTALEPETPEDVGYQFESTDNVEQDILFKERVTLLAQGNPKKEIVLQQWSRGVSDSSIAELLAQLNGGLAESHRKFIQRFKIDCRRELSGS